MFLGMGLGGFMDGILFHQIFQFHAMFSARLPKTSIVNVETNMFWDGMFQAITWTMTVIGLILLWRAVTRDRVLLSTKCFAGSMIMGFGAFNFVEGIIDHHILNLHHVVEALGVSIFDYAFLASGIIMLVAGWSMITKARKDKNLMAAAIATPALA